MSVIMTTFENGVLMPSNADDFFRYHDPEATMVEETGDVESTIGHAVLREVTPPDIAKYASEYGDPWVTVIRNLRPGWYIDVRGSDGTVWAFHYDEPKYPDAGTETAERRARHDFAEAQRVYSEWLDAIFD